MKSQSSMIRNAFIAGVALSMVACGEMKTNPVEDYAELSDSVPPHDFKPRTQGLIKSDIFLIEKNGKPNTILNFAQGRSDKYYILPRLLVPGVEFEVIAQGLPEGAQFAKATDPMRAGEYVLSWHPRAGTLGVQESERKYTIRFEIRLVNADQAARNTVNLIGHYREEEIILVRSSEQPVVTEVAMPSDVLQEGDSMAFTVTVKDPNAYGDYLPRVFVVDEYGASQEAVKVAAAKYVSIERKPKSVGEGLYQFKGRIDTSGIVLPGESDTVPARFVLGVVSQSGLPAPDKGVEVKISRKPKAESPAAKKDGTTGGQS